MNLDCAGAHLHHVAHQGPPAGVGSRHVHCAPCRQRKLGFVAPRLSPFLIIFIVLFVVSISWDLLRLACLPSSSCSLCNLSSTWGVVVVGMAVIKTDILIIATEQVLWVAIKEDKLEWWSTSMGGGGGLACSITVISTQSIVCQWR